MSPHNFCFVCRDFSRDINEPTTRGNHAPPRGALSNLRHSRLHHFLNQCRRQRLVRRKLYSPLRHRKSRKLISKLLNHRRGREQAAMLRKPRVPHQHLLRLERRNLVTDYLHSFRSHRRPNHRAHLLQSAPHWFRGRRNIFLHPLRSILACARNSLAPARDAPTLTRRSNTLIRGSASLPLFPCYIPHCSLLLENPRSITTEARNSTT